MLARLLPDGNTGLYTRERAYWDSSPKVEIRDSICLPETYVEFFSVNENCCLGN